MAPLTHNNLYHKVGTEYGLESSQWFYWSRAVGDDLAFKQFKRSHMTQARPV